MIVAAGDEHDAHHQAQKQKSNIGEWSQLREGHTSSSEPLSVFTWKFFFISADLSRRFTNLRRHPQSAASSKPKRCHRPVCRVAPVRRRPHLKPNHSHSCDKHRFGTPNGPEHHTPL